MLFFWIWRKNFHFLYSVDKNVFKKLPGEAGNVPLVPTKAQLKLGDLPVMFIDHFLIFLSYLLKF